MAIRKRGDFWEVYYRPKDGSGKFVFENMGHGPEGEAAAIARNAELNFGNRKPGIRNMILDTSSSRGPWSRAPI